ncbi:sperm-specific protein PHI-2B-like [Lingula anatina]|uniref:Sperm-specific protein PHI-2B-like n=1 Tax=Lingula anatina TaxID=7574 RepID=A0A1S3JJM8_LINAN|nr:sperm-specific protein PHI-2B-like [Lingula anatina]|eukprot:XP_013410587.1 sperm-specific protein PHI-2B-like [Lingula anatina]
MAGSQTGSPNRSASPTRPASPKRSPPKAKIGPKKRAKSASKKSAHPATLAMVCVAIKALGNRRGSSAQAIRKYILANFQGIRAPMLSAMLRRAFAAGLKSGVLVRPKGSSATGSTGRFRLGKVKAAPKKKKSPKKTKKAKPRRRSSSKSATKKTKRSKSKAKKPAKKGGKAAKKSRSPKKAKKAAAKRPKVAKKATKRPAAKKTKKVAKK